MTYRNISVDADTYNRLKEAKARGESFASVIRRHLPARNNAELLERLKEMGPRSIYEKPSARKAKRVA